MASYQLTVNGERRAIEADPATPLIFIIRNTFGFTGPKLGCGLEQCGACAVLIDGEKVLSCTAAVADHDGGDITTVEGLAADGELNAVQRAFVDAGAAQCGYCIPGLVIAVTELLQRAPSPDEAEIRAALEPHLCRCGSHTRVLAAVRALAREPDGNAA